MSMARGLALRRTGATGSLMNDGRKMPGAHDGMTCFAAADGVLRLLRNHELSSSEARVDDARFYGGLGAGGVTVTVFDPDSEKVGRSPLLGRRGK